MRSNLHVSRLATAIAFSSAFASPSRRLMIRWPARMLDRLRLSMDVLRANRHPAFFLSSATLADATDFAEDLTGIRPSEFLEINDRGAAKASLVPVTDVRCWPNQLRPDSCADISC